MTYYFAPTWFLDFNYTYSVSQKYDTLYAAAFINVTGGLTYTGNAYINTTQRINTQAFAVSVDKVF
ncbi:MAG: hypothetical protein ACXWK3_19970 [Reyranella sp.]